MTFAGAEVQLCPFTREGVGVEVPEAETFYPTPAAAKDAARAIIAKYPAVYAVWVRKVRDGKIRTVSTEYRP